MLSEHFHENYTTSANKINLLYSLFHETVPFQSCISKKEYVPIIKGVTFLIKFFEYMQERFFLKKCKWVYLFHRIIPKKYTSHSE